jgi:endo-1,4-beta-xylanase
MASWFRLVHGIDPKPVLFLNENAGLINWGDDSASKDAFEKTLRSLQAQGAPIGGLGIQAHFGLALTGPEQVVRELDRWAALGLDIQITEFDIAISDEKVQGQYMRDFMTAVFSHPAVSACLIWGFWAGNDWIPEAALYRKDWSIKPNGEAWNDLVLKEWHTDRTMTTDPSGNVATRGFLGTYRITVTYGGKSQTWPLTLPKEGAVLSATLPAN